MPIVSMTKVVIKMDLSSWNESDNLLVESKSLTKCWYLKPALLRAMKAVKNVAKDKMLNPPNCINIKMTTCPLSVKSVPVFTTVNPVIQEALVEVNSASINEIPSIVILGSISNKVPTDINKKNERSMSVGGDT